MHRATDPPQVFDLAAFQALTLHDAGLQRLLIASFLREAAQMRQSIMAACGEGFEAFDDAIHGLRSSSHFVAGRRLSRLLAAVRGSASLRDDAQRERTARLIIEELTALEHVLRSEAAAFPAVVSAN